MSDELLGSSSEPTKMDATASDACTRSGAFALLLSVGLFLLIPYWAHRQEEIALSRYLGHRLNLALRVDALDNDPYWQDFTASHKSAELMSVAQLLEVRVETSATRPNIDGAGPRLPAASVPGAWLADAGGRAGPPTAAKSLGQRHHQLKRDGPDRRCS